mmetsp:Transcript_11927/g.33996  ORF Transcript_11927/g.33996 Transcript_11927/m.33996 type:complete len:500 (-) Transcript_11927:343-1842(-)
MCLIPVPSAISPAGVADMNTRVLLAPQAQVHQQHTAPVPVKPTHRAMPRHPTAQTVQAFRPMSVVFSPQQACSGCCQPGAVNMKVMWTQPRPIVCGQPAVPVLSRKTYSTSPSPAAPWRPAGQGSAQLSVRRVCDGVATSGGSQLPTLAKTVYVAPPRFVRHVSDGTPTHAPRATAPAARGSYGFARQYSEGDAAEVARATEAVGLAAFPAGPEPSAPAAAEAEPLDGGDIVVLAKEAAAPPEEGSPAGGAIVFSTPSERSTSFNSANKSSGTSTPSVPESRLDGQAEGGLEDATPAEECASEEPAAPGDAERPQLGDIVSLGAAAPEECRFHAAVVTNLCTSHCTVIVLDEELRHGIGECWPSYGDVTVKDTLLRLGTRVVVQGMQGARTKMMNGATGVVSMHPTRGHPTFVSKPNSPDQAQLTVCVVFDDPAAVGKKSALVEPRFLRPYEEAVKNMSESVADLVADLSVPSQPEPAHSERTAAIVEALAKFIDQAAQ